MGGMSERCLVRHFFLSVTYTDSTTRTLETGTEVILLLIVSCYLSDSKHAFALGNAARSDATI